MNELSFGQNQRREQIRALQTRGDRFELACGRTDLNEVQVAAEWQVTYSPASSREDGVSEGGRRGGRGAFTSAEDLFAALQDRNLDLRSLIAA